MGSIIENLLQSTAAPVIAGYLVVPAHFIIFIVASYIGGSAGDWLGTLVRPGPESEPEPEESDGQVVPSAKCCGGGPQASGNTHGRPPPHHGTTTHPLQPSHTWFYLASLPPSSSSSSSSPLLLSPAPF
ncbi:hypothetical protein TWF694_002421 [Orbilia ellipsospora]|uniref:Uncharacterized protein n=1 Tax=Orbilia ellipsospora TaxID=2528407 RepID=A0AAV9X249_9PEZI